MTYIGKLCLRGLATVLPIGLTLYVLWWLGTTAEELFGNLFRRAFPEARYVPGLGIAFGFALLLAIGFLMRAVLVRRLYDLPEQLLSKVPLVKSVYGPFKDLMNFFTEHSEREGLQHAVRVRLGDTDADMLGFLTSESAADLTRSADDTERVAVYVPMAYTIGGYMLIVPRSAVTTLDLSVEEVLRLALTAGMSPGGAGTRA